MCFRTASEGGRESREQVGQQVDAQGYSRGVVQGNSEEQVGQQVDARFTDVEGEECSGASRPAGRCAGYSRGGVQGSNGEQVGQ